MESIKVHHSPQDKTCVVCDGIPTKETIRCNKCTRWYHKGCADFDAKKPGCGVCDEKKGTISGSSRGRQTQKCFRCQKPGDVSEFKEATHKGKCVKICKPCHYIVSQDHKERKSTNAISDLTSALDQSQVEQSSVSQSVESVPPPTTQPATIVPTQSAFFVHPTIPRQAQSVPSAQISVVPPTSLQSLAPPLQPPSAPIATQPSSASTPLQPPSAPTATQPSSASTTKQPSC